MRVGFPLHSLPKAGASRRRCSEPFWISKPCPAAIAGPVSFCAASRAARGLSPARAQLDRPAPRRCRPAGGGHARPLPPRAGKGAAGPSALLHRPLRAHALLTTARSAIFISSPSSPGPRPRDTGRKVAPKPAGASGEDPAPALLPRRREDTLPLVPPRTRGPSRPVPAPAGPAM